MPQISRPTSDVTEGGWTPVPIASELDQGVVVASSVNPQGDTFEVHIADLSPATSMPQTLSITLQKTCADCLSATVSLVKGTTIIGQWTVALTSQWKTYPFSLTQAQINQINGDYTNLRVRVSAGPCPSSSSSSMSMVSTSCCPNQLPATLSATIADVGTTQHCPCLDGIAMTLTWDGVSKWTGSTGSCTGHTIRLDLTCSGSSCVNFVATMYCDGILMATFQNQACSCSPLSFTFQGTTNGDCGACHSASVLKIVITP